MDRLIVAADARAVTLTADPLRPADHVRLPALARLALAAILALALAGGIAGPWHAAGAAAAECQSAFVVFTDPANVGDVVNHGRTTFIRHSGVLGSYSGGRLDGYQIAGTQDIRIDNVTHAARLVGSFTATGATGSLLVRYIGQADLTTGAATGTFIANHGTGAFAGYVATGTISAQLIGPATFQGVDIGLC